MRDEKPASIFNDKGEKIKPIHPEGSVARTKQEYPLFLLNLLDRWKSDKSFTIGDYIELMKKIPIEHHANVEKILNHEPLDTRQGNAF